MSNSTITKTIGGDRLGSGKKMRTSMHNYERSTHDTGYQWFATTAPGTLTPCHVTIGLPGDTFDIDIEGITKTAPTIRPMYSSFKQQVDVFGCPIRLYIKDLHNNKLNVGMDMSKVLFPKMTLKAPDISVLPELEKSTGQIDPSSIIAYLGTRALGRAETTGQAVYRNINALPLLAYWDIFKNYYSNKQEKNAYVIAPAITTDLDIIPQMLTKSSGNIVTSWTISPEGNLSGPANYVTISMGDRFEFSGEHMIPDLINVIISPNYETTTTTAIRLSNFMTLQQVTNSSIIGTVNAEYKGFYIRAVKPKEGASGYSKDISLEAFPLTNLDDMREELLSAPNSSPYYINKNSPVPYSVPCRDLTAEGIPNNATAMSAPMAGLAVKTYQSDRFNNWLSEEWIEGTNGISEITAVKVVDGSFTIDSLNLAKKVYNMLNRIAISGGTYQDWQEAVYGQAPMAYESPIYMGGISGEITFDEVTSLAASEGQPLGDLGGKGRSSLRGRTIRIKVQEPMIIMAIVSLTPRITYSQGNEWYTDLDTLDDLHKPELDCIGFQDLLTDEMCGWDTVSSGIEKNATLTKFSIGKQPAWIEYMTATNKAFGNFAKPLNMMSMTLNRMYEIDPEATTQESAIMDATTYIDPTKFNYAFAESDLSAMNFWTMLAFDITARRKMSAKLIPNL